MKGHVTIKCDVIDQLGVRRETVEGSIALTSGVNEPKSGATTFRIMTLSLKTISILTLTVYQ